MANAPRRVGYSGTMPAKIVAILAIKPDARTQQQKDDLEVYYHSIAPELKLLRDQLEAARKKLKADTVTTLVMQRLPQPRKTRVFTGGSILNPGEEVQAGVPAVLAAGVPFAGEPVAAASSRRAAAASAGPKVSPVLAKPVADGPPPANLPSPNRLALARWLVDSENPLTARVEINRLWARHFGVGIVGTLEDFGTKGDRPTHPELLDWLATEFVRRDWDMKQMQRLIVTSAAYRQSSRVSPSLCRAAIRKTGCWLMARECGSKPRWSAIRRWPWPVC